MGTLGLVGSDDDELLFVAVRRDAPRSEDELSRLRVELVAAKEKGRYAGSSAAREKALSVPSLGVDSEFR